MENTLSSDLKHQEHRDWISLLNHYQDEIKFFQNELFRVAVSHPDLPSIQEHVNEYRDLFHHKLRKIDDLRHRIATHENHLAASGETNLTEMHSHAHVRDEMLELETNFENLKQKFRRFASHND